jgi:uncharacterized phage infection (PIP) family protein YhgE
LSEVDRIDAEYTRLQAQADQTVAAIRTLSSKLQAAAAEGNLAAREWNLDLREIALALQAEQQQVATLMRALHDFVVNNAHQALAQIPYQPSVPQQSPPQFQQPQYQPGYQQPAQSGGLLSRFLGGRFGSAMAQGAGMGLGFGLAEDIVDDIF